MTRELITPHISEEGPAQLVLVGASGSGRSRLLQSIVEQLRDSGRETILIRPSRDDVRDQRGIARVLRLDPGKWDDCWQLADLFYTSWESSSRRCILFIDDVDLFDETTLRGMFAAIRRLHLVVVMTSQSSIRLSEGLPEAEFYSLPAWEPDDIRTLIKTSSNQDPIPEVLDRLTSLAEGTPGAAKALTMSLSDSQLLGFEPLVPVRYGAPLDVGLRARVPEVMRGAALLAACAGVCQLSILIAAGETLNIPASDFDDLEREGFLIDEADGLRLKPAALAFSLEALSTSLDRYRTHEALAVAYAESDDARTTWHRAQSVDSDSTDLADRLESLADRPGGILGLVPASQLLLRASELSVAPLAKGRRLAAAAEYAWLEGTPALSLALLSQAESLSADDMLKLRVAYVRGSIELASGGVETALRIMMDSAQQGGRELPTWELTAMLMRACDAAVAYGDVTAAVNLSHLAGRVQTENTESVNSARVALVVGTGKILADQFDAGMELVDEALAMCSGRTDQSHTLVSMRAALLVGDATRLSRLASFAGDLLSENRNRGLLPFVTARHALAEILLGRFRSAVDITNAGVQDSILLGQENARAEHLAVQALALARAGDVELARETAVQTLNLSCDCNLAWAGAIAVWALGEVELSTGNPTNALEKLELLSHGHQYERHPLVATLATAEIVEAALRSDRRQDGDVAFRRLIAWAEATGNSATFGLVERCQALRSESAVSTEESFKRALLLHREAARPFDEARTSLAYGAWLRRERRKADCRAPLRRAHEIFENLGASIWQAKAEQEIRASGEAVRRQQQSGGERILTAQELVVARMVAGGSSNRDVAEKLYLSVRTVEYHLRNVFAKLGVRSRTELAARRSSLESL